MSEQNPRPDVHGKGQRAVKLHKLGLSAQEIAERIGSPVTSVYHMLKKAKETEQE